MSSQAPLLFLIVGRNEPLYSAEFTNANDRPSTASDSTTRQNYFVMHSALDLVDKQVWTTSSMYLKVVDKVNHQLVSAFLTASHVKFLLLHQGRSDDTIKFFFQEIYELYVKVSYILRHVHRGGI
jgi:hypothetical protein